MNRQAKVFSTLTIVSAIIVCFSFFMRLRENDYSILITLKERWVNFLYPLGFAYIAKSLNSISSLPSKNTDAEVVAFETKWDYHSRNRYYIATFKVYNDLLWTFEVPEDIFNKLFIGQRGILSYREKNSKFFFVFFSSLDNQEKR